MVDPLDVIIYLFYRRGDFAIFTQTPDTNQPIQWIWEECQNLLWQSRANAEWSW